MSTLADDDSENGRILDAGRSLAFPLFLALSLALCRSPLGIGSIRTDQFLHKLIVKVVDMHLGSGAAIEKFEGPMPCQ